MAARTAYVLAGLLLVGVFGAAFVSRSESREDFIIRQQAGDIVVDGPELNFDFDGPDVDGPDVNGPNIDGPELTFWDVLYNLFLVALVIAMVVGLILVVKRFGPGSGDEDVDDRTTRLDSNRHDYGRVEGEEGWAAFERFCYQLLQDPDPSRAVRIVMRYAEAGLGRLDQRIADETPNEWLRRTRSNQHDLAHHLAPIISSYNSVRFGGNGASPAERDQAVNALRTLARAACDRPPEAPDIVGATGGNTR